jgi:hypothetical protein
MTDAKKTRPDEAPEATNPEDQTAHTELRPAGKGPKPRAKVLPPEVRDGDDDMFNDLPV